MRGKLLLLAVSLLFCGAALEVGLRVWQRSEFPRGYYRMDERSGLLSAAPGWRGHQDSEFGRVVLTTNRYGMRGPVLDPAAAGPRVLLIGDSFIQAARVRDEQTVGRRLAARLPGAQVMEVGMPGWGQGDELRWLETYGPELRPDLVVVCVFLGNDLAIDNTYPDHLGSSRLTATPDGYLVVSGVRKNTGRAEPGPARGGFAEWLRDHTTRASLAYLFLRARVARLLAGAARGEPAIPDYYERFLAIHARDETVRAGYYATFFALVERLRAQAEREGWALLVATIPWHVTLDDAAFLAIVDHFGLDREAYERELPFRLLAEGLAARGVAQVDVARAFSARADPGAAYGANPHFSPTGHEWLAQALAPRVEELVAR